MVYQQMRLDGEVADTSEEQMLEELKDVIRFMNNDASPEQLQVAEELSKLANQREFKKLLSNPSSPALETAAPETGSGMGTIRKNVKDLFTLYLTNQFVARAINVRADTLVSKGYKIIGDDKRGVELCQELIRNNGDISLFKQLSINTDIAGDGYLEVVSNQNFNRFVKLRHIHPLTMSYKRDKKSGKIIVNKHTKQPVAFTQTYIDAEGVIIEKDIPIDRIKHLKYSVIGDEFTGLSTLQSGYDTIVRLMNMEYSAAHAAVKTANPLLVATANTKSPHQVALWGKLLGRINSQEQVVLPEGMQLSMLSPGSQNFNDYAEYFLNAIVATFGVPRNILLGGNISFSNRSEGVILARQFYVLIRELQLLQEQLFNEIFEEYSKIAGFKAPKLYFNDISEDQAVSVQSAVDLFKNGIISREEARKIIGFEGDMKSIQTDRAKAEVDRADRETQFPSDNKLSPAGSQKNIKRTQKNDPYSTVSKRTK